MGIRCKDIRLEPVAAPATVSGEFFVICHWDIGSWEGDEE